jgi:hypothetical protein
MVERPSGFRARRAFFVFGLEVALGSQTVPIRFRLRRRADLTGKPVIGTARSVNGF